MKKLFSIITEYDKQLPYYLLGVGTDWEQEHVLCPKGYYYQWIQCVKGEGELITSGKTYRVKEGSGMLLFLGVPHEYYAISPSWIVEWIVFDGTQVEHFLKSIVGIKTSTALYTSRPDVFLSRIRSAITLLESDSTLKNIQCSNIIYGLLTDIVQFTSVNPNNSALHQHFKLKPLLDYIEHNFNRPLTLETMANVIDVTPPHLCTIFKKTTNIRIFQYINSVRIQKSKQLLLQNPQMQIKEIALLCGFEDVNYFCYVFKKLENISPSQFRKYMLSPK